jgi:hypothetical protein
MFMGKHSLSDRSDVLELADFSVQAHTLTR